MRRFLVIGDLNVDVIISGMTQLPELGREILCDDIRTVLGGSASIFACRLGQLGASVDIFGKVGNDENGRIVLNTLRSNNVGIEKVIVEENLRTGVTVSLTYPRDKALVTFIGSIGALGPSDIRPELFHGYGHLHISSIYFQSSLLGSFADIFMRAKKHGLTTSLDPQSDPLDRYEGIWKILEYTDVFLPNDREAKGITKAATLDAALKRLSSNGRAVLVKCGSRGALGQKANKTVEVRPIKIEPIDTTGAGDSFDAGFIYYSLWKGEEFEASVKFANAMGALSCLHVGGAGGKITEKDVLGFLSKAV